MPVKCYIAKCQPCGQGHTLYHHQDLLDVGLLFEYVCPETQAICPFVVTTDSLGDMTGSNEPGWIELRTPGS